MKKHINLDYSKHCNIHTSLTINEMCKFTYCSRANIKGKHVTENLQELFADILYIPILCLSRGLSGISGRVTKKQMLGELSF